MRLVQWFARFDASLRKPQRFELRFLLFVISGVMVAVSFYLGVELIFEGYEPQQLAWCIGLLLASFIGATALSLLERASKSSDPKVKGIYESSGYPR